MSYYKLFRDSGTQLLTLLSDSSARLHTEVNNKNLTKLTNLGLNQKGKK